MKRIVPDAAVEAACGAFYRTWTEAENEDVRRAVRDRMRLALEAALEVIDEGDWQ